MFTPTKMKALYNLREALYHLTGSINQSQDLITCIDELNDVIAHLDNIESDNV